MSAATDDRQPAARDIISARDRAWFAGHAGMVEMARALYRDEAVDEEIAQAVEALADPLLLVILTRVRVPMWGTYTPELICGGQRFATQEDWEAHTRPKGTRALPHLIARDGAVIATRRAGSRRWVMGKGGEDA